MAASEDEFGGTRTVDERASWAFEQAEAMARSTIAAIEEWLDVPDCDRKEVALNRILAAWPDKLLARKS